MMWTRDAIVTRMCQMPFIVLVLLGDVGIVKAAGDDIMVAAGVVAGAGMATTGVAIADVAGQLLGEPRATRASSRHGSTMYRPYR